MAKKITTLTLNERASIFSSRFRKHFQPKVDALYEKAKQLADLLYEHQGYAAMEQQIRDAIVGINLNDHLPTITGLDLYDTSSRITKESANPLTLSFGKFPTDKVTGTGWEMDFISGWRGVAWNFSRKRLRFNPMQYGWRVSVDELKGPPAKLYKALVKEHAALCAEMEKWVDELWWRMLYKVSSAKKLIELLPALSDDVEGILEEKNKQQGPLVPVTAIRKARALLEEL